MAGSRKQKTQAREADLRLRGSESPAELRKKIMDNLAPPGDDKLLSWFSEKRIVASFGVSAVAKAGNRSEATLLARAKKLRAGQLLELHTPSQPLAIIESLEKLGLMTCSLPGEKGYVTYAWK